MSFPFISKLPEHGARETDTLDFKCEVESGTDLWKLAKDVAALANASGGSILVGACGGTTLAHYKPLTRDECLDALKKYEEAVRDRCSPAPSIAHEYFTHATGVALAVHVAPFPAVVAVRVVSPDVGSGDDAWIFVRRVASQNVSFRPEELPMLMTPEIRRTAILLRGIGDGTAYVVLRTAPDHDTSRQRYDGGRAAPQPCLIKDVDELRNSVLFENKLKSDKFAVPLDHVRTVFRDHAGDWIVDVGFFSGEKT